MDDGEITRGVRGGDLPRPRERPDTGSVGSGNGTAEGRDHERNKDRGLGSSLLCMKATPLCCDQRLFKYKNDKIMVV